jgi:hypothetical protein
MLGNARLPPSCPSFNRLMLGNARPSLVYNRSRTAFSLYNNGASCKIGQHSLTLFSLNKEVESAKFFCYTKTNDSTTQTLFKKEQNIQIREQKQIHVGNRFKPTSKFSMFIVAGSASVAFRIAFVASLCTIDRPLHPFRQLHRTKPCPVPIDSAVAASRTLISLSAIGTSIGSRNYSFKTVKLVSG